MQDGIGHRGDAFGTHLARGWPKQGEQFGSSLAQIFMRVPFGLALWLPMRSRLRSGGVGTGLILAP
jgi:hypothetical protein